MAAGVSPPDRRRCVPHPGTLSFFTIKASAARPLPNQKSKINNRHSSITGVYLPCGLDAKYPNAGKQWPWFWVFPAAQLSTDPRGNTVRRHHEGDHLIQRAMKEAVHASGITKPATPHSKRSQ